MKKSLLLTLILLGLLGPARAQFTVQDVRIGDPAASYLDFEIWQAGNRLCFQDENNRGYVGRLDSLTGNLVSASGKDFLFDTGLTPITQSINGPEWGYRVGGADVFYTKQIGTADKHIGQARWTGTAYTATDLSATLPGRRFATICSKNPTDPAARLVYARGNSLLNFTIHWSEAVSPVRDVPVPYGANSSSGPRFIDGEQALLTNDVVNGTTQIFRYDLATAALTQLTFDAGNKIDAFMWNAPDFGNAWLLYCTVNDTTLRLYRQVGSTFARVYDIKLPNPTYGYYFSAEPFVFQNKSYLFVCAAAQKFVPGSQNSSLPADVWVVGLDPARPLFRKVSDNRVALRLDPEVFLTPTDAYIYYYEYRQNGNVHPVALRKCSAGLASFPLSAAPAAPAAAVAAFPNPAQNTLTVSAGAAMRQLTLYDALGNKVLDQRPERREAVLDLSPLADGLYFLRTDANPRTTQKILIQR